MTSEATPAGSTASRTQAPLAPWWRREVLISAAGRELVAAAAALAVLVTLLFSDTVLGGRVFYQRDVHLVWHPQAHALRQAIASGAWPLWDPSAGFGQPLLADPSAQVLYPFTWLRAALSPSAYYSVYVVFHGLGSGLGLYLLARHLGTGFGGALSASALWVASGPFLSLASLWHHLAGAAWLPWVFLAADRTFQRGGVRDALLWAGAMAMQMLAGSADLVAMTALVTTANALRHVRWTALGTASHRRLLGLMALSWMLALALAAPQWLPTLELARASARRELDPAMRTFWSVHPLGMLQLWLPAFVEGYVAEPAVRALLYESREPFLLSLYVGMSSLVLVAAAFASPPAAARLLRGVFLVSALLALGRHAPFYPALALAVPPLRILRFPVKAMVVAAFAWSMLAGVGLSRWRAVGSASAERLRRILLGVLALFIVAAGMGMLIALSSESSGRAPEPLAVLSRSLRPSVPRLAVASALGTLALVCAWRRHARGGAAAALAAAAAVLDPTLVHRGLNPTAPPEFDRYRPPLVDVLRNDGATRVYVYEYQLVQGKSREHLGRDEPYLAEHVPSVPPALLVAAAMRSYLSPPLPGMYGFDGSFDVDLRGLYSEPQARLVDLLHVNEGTPIHRRLLQMGSVSHVVALHAATFRDLERLAVLPSSFPEPIHVFRVPATLPRAFAVGGARVAQGPDALRTLIDPAFDPAREVLLDEGAPRDPPRGFGARVRIVSARADRALLEAEMEHPGFVVLTEGYDPGWRARIDGRPAPVLRANLGFRAVAVGPGRHAIEYVYRPASVRLGAGLFALGLLGFAAAALGRARRPPPPA